MNELRHQRADVAAGQLDDGEAKNLLVDRHAALGPVKVEAQDIALFSLLTACQLQRLVFTSHERSAAQKQVDALVLGEAYGEALANLLSDIDHAAGEAVDESGVMRQK